MVNETMLRFVGYTRAEITGKNVSSLVPDILAPMHDQFIENYISSGNARVIGRGRDVLLQDKNRHLVHCFLRLSECKRGSSLFFVAQLDKYNSLDNAKKDT
eukprot:TRINITY_DN8954_c0_g1_i2.p1 TRINITY_DN8954_c0_g1~~TRINITY_DN8954_c0_g1_i2.p1  ORF type:complete len:101 (+),score=1.69 TRINITY_DN8954_c0_g1_i2:253-555(+)